MNLLELQRIASGKNASGSPLHRTSYLSHIIQKIVQGRKNLIIISENVAGFALTKELFTPEYEINMDYLEANPEVAQAYAKAYPNRPPEEVRFEDSEQMDGMVNGVKGKLFEQKVAEKLNNGERVGDIQLEEGQTAVLADSPIQEGYDFIIKDSNGNQVDVYQLKSTDSESYVNSAVHNNPDTEVISTSEAAGASNSVHDADITDALMTESTAGMVDLDYLGDLPLVGGLFFGWTALTNTYRVMKGEIGVAAGINNISDNVVKYTISAGVGAAVEVAAISLGVPPTGWLGAGFSMITRKLLNNFNLRNIIPQVMDNHLIEAMVSTPQRFEPQKLVYRRKLLSRYGIEI